MAVEFDMPRSPLSDAALGMKPSPAKSPSSDQANGTTGGRAEISEESRMVENGQWLLQLTVAGGVGAKSKNLVVLFSKSGGVAGRWLEEEKVEKTWEYCICRGWLYVTCVSDFAAVSL